MFELLGFGDGKGNLSFNKMVTSTSLGLLWYMITHHYDPAWPTLMFGIIVIGAGFGLKGYLGGVKQVQMMGSAHVHTDAAKVIEALQKRDPSSGIDPA
jgi:hypothetical protein